MLALLVISRLPLSAGGQGWKAMRIILCVALLALCVLGKEEEKSKDEKSDVAKRAFIHSPDHLAGHDLTNSFSHSLNGVSTSPSHLIGSGFIGQSNLYAGQLDYGKDYGHIFGSNLGGVIHGHHAISSPPVVTPQVITQTVTVDKPFPVPHPVPVKVNRPVAVPVAVPQPYPVHVNKPYPVEVVKPVGVPVEREVPYQVVKPVPYPVEQIVRYPVEKRVYIPVHIPVERKYIVNIPKPYPVYQEKIDRYPVERPVHVPVQVKVNVPVPQPVPVPVDRPYPVNIPHPVPVRIERPVPVTVHRPVPVHIVNKVAVPVPHPYPVHVEKHVPVPVPNKAIVPTHFGVDSDLGIDIRFGNDAKTVLQGSALGGYQDGQYLTGSQRYESFLNAGHLPTTDYSHLFSSQSFGTDGLQTFGGATTVNIDKSIELPLKFYRSTSDKIDTVAAASEPLPAAAKKDASEPLPEKAKKE